MAKVAIKPNPRVNQVFEELEKYLEFCRSFGYRYNEADLHNWKSYAWQQYSKHAQGKHAKDMWTADTKTV